MMSTIPKRAKCNDCFEYCYPKICCECKAYLCAKCYRIIENKIYCKGCYIDKFEINDYNSENEDLENE